MAARALGEGLGERTAHALWFSLYALWLALFIAEVAGAGRDLPIAGGGITGGHAAQMISTVLLNASIIV